MLIIEKKLKGIKTKYKRYCIIFDEEKDYLIIKKLDSVKNKSRYIAELIKRNIKKIKKNYKKVLTKGKK